ncbi:MAG TPA: hypothetical protein VMW78_09075 [Anaerolineae bacterium]|nr:hypothetical protein [Anaerolineae bacterium]
MNLNSKLDVLDRIYKVYDDFARDLDVVCKRCCASCCTRNVTLTTLEGYKIVEYLILDGKADLFNGIRKDLHKKRFQPAITTNRLAELSVAGEDIPDEDSRYFQEECPILTDRQCPVYKVRPFGCRCFVSKHNCREKGYAEVDEFILTVNNIFLQYIEHVDSQGCSGNFTDVLLFLESGEVRRNYREGLVDCAENTLVSNRSMPAFMIPPEHRLKIQPILQAILSL